MRGKGRARAIPAPKEKESTSFLKKRSKRLLFLRLRPNTGQ
jgi:hypothetical protein